MTIVFIISSLVLLLALGIPLAFIWENTGRSIRPTTPANDP